MAAIDAMLDQLEDMGLSAAEINIFLNLKLRERAEEETHVKVAVMECNPENLSQMSEQLRHINGVDLYSYLLESVKQYPYQLGEDFDLVVTTAAHAEFLEEILPEKKRMARVALRPSARCLSHIIKLRAGQKVGILGYSSRFAQLLYTTCQTYAEEAVICEPVDYEGNADIKAYLQGKDAVLVPRGYEKYFAPRTVELLRRFDGNVIECHYVMDEGSVLYLENKIKRILETRTI